MITSEKNLMTGVNEVLSKMKSKRLTIAVQLLRNSSSRYKSISITNLSRLKVSLMKCEHAEVSAKKKLHLIKLMVIKF